MFFAKCKINYYFRTIEFLSDGDALVDPKAQFNLHERDVANLRLDYGDLKPTVPQP